MFGFGFWELLLVLTIVALLFGTKRLSKAGSDLGSAIQNFKSALSHKSESLEDEEVKSSVNSSNDESSHQVEESVVIKDTK